MKLCQITVCFLLAFPVLCSRTAGSGVAPSSENHGAYPVHKFHSSKVQAPVVEFTRRSLECNDGLYYMITPRGWKVKSPGPMILDDNGELIWFKHFANEFGGQAYDLKVQSYRGQDYLTFWLGDDRVRGHGAGQFYMLNASYDVVHQIGGANGIFADLHEFVITTQGTALILIYQPTEADVRPAGRKFNDLWNQAIWDCVFQEFSIETGELLFEWRASEHLKISKAYNGLEPWADEGTRDNPFDWFHGNSVQKDDLGNYLISARNIHAVLYIDGKTKQTIWTLGGKDNDFLDLSAGYALNFAWQHDARFVSPTAFPEIYKAPSHGDRSRTILMTLFDNAAFDWDYSYGSNFSRALLLEVTYPTTGVESIAPKPLPNLGETKPPISDPRTSEKLSKTDFQKINDINQEDHSYLLRVLRAFIHPNNVISSTQGSVQLLSQGEGIDPRVLVGYGINSVVTEFSSNGTVLCDLHFGAATSWETGDVQSYRAYKQSWVGQPNTAPSAVLHRGVIYASWNGATEHRKWVVETSNKCSGGNWLGVFDVPRNGFETAINLRHPNFRPLGRYWRVVALDQTAEPCVNGESNVIDLGMVGYAIRQRTGFGSRYEESTLFFGLVSFLALLWLVYRIYRRRSRAYSGRSVLPRQRKD